MNIIKKLGLFHWNIGFIEETPETTLNNQNITKNINWLPDTFRDRFFADPFILNVTDSTIEVFVEEYIYAERKGRIALLTIDRYNYTLLDIKTILNLQTHLSFPFIFRENDKIYVIPENSESGKLPIYEYNNISRTLEFRKALIEYPLVDPVILKHESTYYLLCTYKDKHENADLYVYYSDSLMGKYSEIDTNPVKNDISSSRPGGSFFESNGSLYRIAQNNQTSYGEGISITQIMNISRKHFEEKTMVKLYPNKIYPYGMHTLNNLDGITVIDGLYYLLSPINKIKSIMGRPKRSKI
jgi:hypothetical protein